MYKYLHTNKQMDAYMKEVHKALGASGEDGEEVELVLEDGLDFILGPAHPWLNGMDEIVEYMRTRIPIHAIPTYIRLCEIVADTVDNLDVGDRVVEALYRMYGEYPCIRTMDLTFEMLVYYAFSRVWIYPAMEDAIREEILPLHVREEASRIWNEDMLWVDMNTLCAGLRVLLAMVHNAQISPLCVVWDEHYNNEGCFTTWLPREMMEDVAWISGMGTELMVVPTMQRI